MNARTIIVVYLLLQAVATAAWWILLLSLPESVSWFQPLEWPQQALLGFWLPDGLLVIVGSVTCAGLVYKNHPYASFAIWMLAVAAWYPALYCIGVSALTSQGWIASGLMSCMAGLSLSMATIFGINNSPAAFRAVKLTKASALCWTLAQIVIFWGVFLWVIPMAIVELEGYLSLPRFMHPFQRIGSITLLVAASSLGLWSAWTMATCGAGTPLPTATASNLVIAGPYRMVRNPMAVAGIAQGAAVGWLCGSYSVIVYALTGIFAWHVFVRPSEEADLKQRFGEGYTAYRESVNLWIPRRSSRDLHQ